MHFFCLFYDTAHIKDCVLQWMVGWWVNFINRKWSWPEL